MFSVDKRDLLCSRTPSEYIAAILELSSLVVRRQHVLHHHFDWIFRLTANGRRFYRACHIVHSFTADVIQQRQKALTRLGQDAWFKSKQGKTVDFIDVLLLAKVLGTREGVSPIYVAREESESSAITRVPQPVRRGLWWL